jgi:hypothetical protein
LLRPFHVFCSTDLLFVLKEGAASVRMFSRLRYTTLVQSSRLRKFAVRVFLLLNFSLAQQHYASTGLV